jgi:hypothetical protein
MHSRNLQLQQHEKGIRGSLNNPKSRVHLYGRWDLLTASNSSPLLKRSLIQLVEALPGAVHSHLPRVQVAARFRPPFASTVMTPCKTNRNLK